MGSGAEKGSVGALDFRAGKAFKVRITYMEDNTALKGPSQQEPKLKVVLGRGGREQLSEEAGGWIDYVRIARPDHWFKNVFLIPGAFLAPFFFPITFSAELIAGMFLAVASVCLVASSNYVLNELLDAESDRSHPVKKHRPLAAGRVSLPLAYTEWILLGVTGIGLGFLASEPLGICSLALWIMGLLYNVPPVRLKEVPFFDVLSESVNNPLRLAIGWYAMGVSALPPISVLFSYWMIGAFFMATKRFAEYRKIGDPERAAAYRRSFAFYNEPRLLASNFFYVALFMTGLMAFIMLYRLELVFVIPGFAYVVAYYSYLGFRDDSPVQYPELLYRDVHLMAAVSITFVLSLALFFFIDLPWFRDLFTVLVPM